MAKKDVLQPVDADARRLAGDLVRTARFAALATLDPVNGGPNASRVSLATAMDGRPIFLISRLSAHFGALEADPRASLLVGEPGSGDPLAHPRMTVSGRARLLEGEDRDRCRSRFLLRHPKAQLYVDFPDFAFWALEPDRGSLNGGFAKAYELTTSDLIHAPDPELEKNEAGAVAHINEDHSDVVALYAEQLLKGPKGKWRLTGLDSLGLDLSLADTSIRLWFDTPLEYAADLRPRVVQLAKLARSMADQV